MAAVARQGLRKGGDRPMSKKLSGPATAVVAGNVPAPVRVRLKRVSCSSGAWIQGDRRDMLGAYPQSRVNFGSGVV